MVNEELVTDLAELDFTCNNHFFSVAKALKSKLSGLPDHATVNVERIRNSFF